MPTIAPVKYAAPPMPALVNTSPASGEDPADVGPLQVRWRPRIARAPIDTSSFQIFVNGTSLPVTYQSEGGGVYLVTAAHATIPGRIFYTVKAVAANLRGERGVAVFSFTTRGPMSGEHWKAEITYSAWAANRIYAELLFSAFAGLRSTADVSIFFASLHSCASLSVITALAQQIKASLAVFAGASGQAKADLFVSTFAAVREIARVLFALPAAQARAQVFTRGDSVTADEVRARLTVIQEFIRAIEVGLEVSDRATNYESLQSIEAQWVEQVAGLVALTVAGRGKFFQAMNAHDVARLTSDVFESALEVGARILSEGTANVVLTALEVTEGEGPDAHADLVDETLGMVRE